MRAAMVTRPLESGRGLEVASGSALHDFSNLEADEVEKALAVLVTQEVGGASEVSEGELRLCQLSPMPQQFNYDLHRTRPSFARKLVAQ